MPFAPIDQAGTVLHYEDSGAPANSLTYTTLVILHGGFFNGGIFKPLLPFAFANNVRLVLLDARDNGQSTLYTEAELKAIYSRDKAIETEFLRSGVIEFATFLAWFIKHEDVPAIKEDIESGEKTGGINLVSWSSGSNWFIPFFAMADTIPEDIRKALDAYLGGYILFDAPFCTVGLPNPPLDKVYSCMRDPALTQEERFAMFPATVSGYYSKHAPIVRAALIATSLDTLPPVSEFWDGIQKRHDTEPDAKSPTIFRIPKDTLSKIASHEPFIRSTVQIIMGFHSEIYAECIEKVVNDVQLATCFPKARIHVVSCMQGEGECLTTTYTIKKMVLERQAKGQIGREIDVRLFEGANHVPHWDTPEKTVKFFASIVSGKSVTL